MSQLAQVYIRLKPFSIDKEQLDHLGHQTDDIVRAAAIEHYEQPIEIDVLLESGTLRAVLTVTGSIIFGTYYVVGNYKGFKESVVEIVNDGQKFGRTVTDAFIKATRVSPRQVESKSIRKKTPGKLKRVLADLERLEEAAAQTGGRYSVVGLSRVSKRLRDVMRELDQDEAAGLLNLLKFENLPPIEKWPHPVSKPESDRVAVQPGGRQLDLIEEELKVSQRRKKLRYHSRVLVNVREDGSATITEIEPPMLEH